MGALTANAAGAYTLFCKVYCLWKLDAVTRIIRATHLGMCFGVRDAIALALEHAGAGPITILGDLVHNPRSSPIFAPGASPSPAMPPR